jgi:hypothetical protein
MRFSVRTGSGKALSWCRWSAPARSIPWPSASVYSLSAGLALRILVSLNSSMMVTSRVLSVCPFGSVCGRRLFDSLTETNPPIYPDRCTRSFQCTHDVPGAAGWAWTGANRAGQKCRPKCFILEPPRTRADGKERLKRSAGAQGRNRIVSYRIEITSFFE